jgi:hypothetical protein
MEVNLGLKEDGVQSGSSETMAHTVDQRESDDKGIYDVGRSAFHFI